MARVKRAVHARKKRREILEQAKGYYGARHRRMRMAKEQLLHSGVDTKATAGKVKLSMLLTREVAAQVKVIA